MSRPAATQHLVVPPSRRSTVSFNRQPQSTSPNVSPKHIPVIAPNPEPPDEDFSLSPKPTPILIRDRASPPRQITFAQDVAAPRSDLRDSIYAPRTPLQHVAVCGDAARQSEAAGLSTVPEHQMPSFAFPRSGYALVEDTSAPRGIPQSTPQRHRPNLPPSRPSLHIQTSAVQVHRYSSSSSSASSSRTADTSPFHTKDKTLSPHIIEISSSCTTSPPTSPNCLTPLNPHSKPPSSPRVTTPLLDALRRHKTTRDRTPTPKKRKSRIPSLIPQTPIALPRRLSRFPSFLSREKRLLPYTFKTRDAVFLTALVASVAAVVSVGALCGARKDLVCRRGWLVTAANGFLPDLVLGGPYTAIVVGVGLSEWGRRRLRGRWTMMLYAGVVSVGRVFVGCLMGNLSWEVVRC